MGTYRSNQTGRRAKLGHQRWDYAGFLAPNNNYAKARKDRRKELGELLEPFAKFDATIERFVCNGCASVFETYRGIQAHIETEHV
jgi:hypothetical protein